jgi:hypothetical protein
LARKRHAKTETRTHTSMPKNLRQKGLTNVVKVCVKITSDFVSKGQMDVQQGNMVLKRSQTVVKGVCRPMYTGFSLFYGRLFPVTVAGGGFCCASRWGELVAARCVGLLGGQGGGELGRFGELECAQASWAELQLDGGTCAWPGSAELRRLGAAWSWSIVGRAAG